MSVKQYNDNIIENFSNFNFFFSWIPVLQVALLGVFLLFVIIFFPKNSKGSLVLNRFLSFFVVYSLWDLSLGDFVAEKSITTNSQGSGSFTESLVNELYKKNIDSNIQSFEVIQYFFKANQENLIFFYLILFYVFIVIFLFFFGILDRSFISNSGDMEFTILICFIFISSLMIFKEHNFLDIILSLEVITLASYVLIAFEKKNRFNTYAGIQYFVLGSLPSGMLVLGAGLIYSQWGTLVLEDLDVLLSKISNFTIEDNLYDVIKSKINNSISQLPVEYIYPNVDQYLIWNNNEYLYLKSKNVIFTFATVIALSLLFFNFLFKVTSAPFHVWAPSIYGKGPIASVTFLSIFSKVIIFFLMFKMITIFSFGYSFVLTPFLLFCGVLSVIFGMIGAFTEKLVKRFFVYSSMSHVGFMLVGLSLANLEGAAATFHYLPVYVLSSFIMWFILLYIGKQNRFLTQFKMLKNMDFTCAIIFSFLIFSMSGIPPLGGFFIKLDILLVLLESSRFYLNYVLFLLTVASFFYYLRVIKIMFFDVDAVVLKKKNRSEERLWVIAILFLILLFYIVIVQKPLLYIQTEFLNLIF